VVYHVNNSVMQLASDHWARLGNKALARQLSLVPTLYQTLAKGDNLSASKKRSGAITFSDKEAADDRWSLIEAPSFVSSGTR
jgi:hypothetical protein